MPKAHMSEEVQILRFFEGAPIEQAEMLFNIVKEKMRTRSAANPNAHGGTTRKKGRQPIPSDGIGEKDCAKSSSEKFVP